MKQLCWSIWVVAHTTLVCLGFTTTLRWWVRWAALVAWVAATFWWIGPKIQEL